MTGVPARKTEPHQKRSSRRPPASGPMAVPAEKLAIQAPTATVRSAGFGNMLRIKDRLEGASVAPASPRAARAAISMPALLAKAAKMEAMPKARAPASSRRRRPMRSPSVPMGMSDPARTKP